MANALGYNLKPGSVVRVAAKYFSRPLPAMKRRYFVAEDGFGMSNVTAGQAIIGHWQCDGVKSRIEGYMIDQLVSEPEEVPAHDG